MPTSYLIKNKWIKHTKKNFLTEDVIVKFELLLLFNNLGCQTTTLLKYSELKRKIFGLPYYTSYIVKICIEEDKNVCAIDHNFTHLQNHKNIHFI